jgi:hypothetical protein
MESLSSTRRQVTSPTDLFWLIDLYSYLKYITKWSRVLLEKLILAQLLTNSPPFMEPECSLPCSQEPATGPYPEPDESNPNLPPYFPKIHFNIILSPTPWSSEWSLLFRIPNQIFVRIYNVCNARDMPCPSHPPCFVHPNN